MRHQQSQTESQSRTVVARGSEKRRMENYCLTDTEFRFGKMQNVLEMDSNDSSCTTMSLNVQLNVFNDPELYKWQEGKFHIMCVLSQKRILQSKIK